jgi:hypothetical protein
VPLLFSIPAASLNPLLLLSKPHGRNLREEEEYCPLALI